MVRRLEKLAAERGTSASEIVRQAIDSHDVKDGGAMGSSELLELVSARLKGAIQSMRHAQRTGEPSTLFGDTIRAAEGSDPMYD